MKKTNRFMIVLAIIALLVFALSWVENSASATAVSDTNDVVEITPNELEPSTRVGNMRVSDLTGAPLALYRVNYPVADNTPEEMARQYLQENADLLQLQSPDLSDLEYRFLHDGPAGPTVRFNQVVNGIPVYNAVIAVHINNDNMVTYVANDYKSNISLDSFAPTISKNDARSAALNYLGIQGALQLDQTELVLYQVQDQTYLAYEVRLIADSLLGDWQVMVDAHTGEFLKVFDTSYTYSHEADINQPAINNQVPVTGTGTVFDPDPLSSAQATYGDPGFTDGGDADTAQLNAELMTVDLLEIDFTGGMYTLIGPYAEIVDTEGPFNGLFSQATDTFNFNRFDDAFEAVNTYYHIDSSMRYINETLGVPIAPFQYSGGARFDPHGLNGADNSHYTSGNGVVAFGEGGVDDAEDSDVIHHELGHALHDWVTNGSLSQVTGLSEGLGDYWAQSYNRSLGNWTPADPPYQWVFNWDGHNPFWPGRITNYAAVYPGGLVGQIHTDGQIWSTCNMKVYDAIGRIKIDTAMWEGLAMTNSSTNQEDAANAVYQAAIDMGYPGADLQAMHDIYGTCVYVVPPVPFIEIGVDPGSLSSSQFVDTQVVQTLTISNTGTTDLDWDIYEDASSFGGSWSDDFDSYATGSQMHGQGGWKGWDNSPAAGAVTTDTQALSTPNSVEILGSSDLVHEFSSYTSGQWILTAWQYIPSSMSGQTYFILLNNYTDGGPYNWSTTVDFNSGTGLMTDFTGGATLPFAVDVWKEIRVEIDLDADTQSFYYDDQLLYSAVWSGYNGGTATPQTEIATIDLYANAATSVYYDNISILPPDTICDAPDDIPWVTVSPISGTIPAASTDLVNVTFDSTGLPTGVYTGTLCVNSNDPVTPLIEVPIEMTVNPLPDITITTPVSGTVLTALNGTDLDTTVAVTVTNDFMIPDDGHWHLWVDGSDTGPVMGYTDTVNLTVGTHVITAQLQAPDHTPLGPVDTTVVEVVGADIIITAPADGTVFTATNGVNISVTISVTTPNFTIPGDGHWHLWVDGTDVGPVMGDVVSTTLVVGTHVITAQLQNPDHMPLGPTDSITVTVVAEKIPEPMFYIYLPFVARSD